MICFPDLDSLTAALRAGRVPTALRRAPAAVGVSEQRLWLRPSIPLSADDRTRLLRLGAEFPDEDVVPLTEEVCCWDQLLPLFRDMSATPGPETPVLFEVAVARWPALAAELCRLGRPRMAVLWNEEAQEGTVWVRVVGAPSLSLLRSQPDGDDPPDWRCYVEQAPRVWVELGWRQLLVEDIEPPTGCLLLIRAPRCWTFVADSGFRDELTELSLPTFRPRRRLKPVALGNRRLPTPLGLIAGGKADDAELWVLREDPLVHLSALVQDAGDELLGRLTFVVAEREGRPIVVIRAPTARRGPPVLELPAPGFRSNLKLPNLFLPCGYRLCPPLRRDAVRELLADDSSQIVWLFPGGGRSFRWESVPADAFRSLREAVDYLVPPERRHLSAWEATEDFAFEPFAVAPEESLLVLKLRAAAPPPPRQGWFDRLRSWWQKPEAPPPEAAAEAPPAPILPPVPPRPPREEQPRRRRTEPRRDRIAEAVHLALQRPTGPDEAQKPGLHPLEEDFLALNGRPDAPERLALWPELADHYWSHGNPGDSAVCCMNALWEAAVPEPVWWWGWFRAEAQAAHWFDVGNDLRRSLTARQPEPADVRAVAAFCAWSAWGEGTEESWDAPPDRLREFLELHEALVPARSAWLAWSGLSKHSGGDVLALARARDRLLERLFHRGLSPERDLPGFLRFGGRGLPKHFPTLSGWLAGQRERIDRWIEKVQADQPRDPAEQVTSSILLTESYFGKEPPYRPLPYGPAGNALLTKAYADLVLAWGLARLGGAAGCGLLVEQARDVLENLDPVHTFLFRAYLHRVDQALEGRADGPLPEALLDEWQHMGPHPQRDQADQLRRQSFILAPGDRLDPYLGQVQHPYPGELGRQLAALADVHDRHDLGEQLRRLLREAGRGSATASALPRVLRVALEYAPRIGEGFARDMLAALGPVLDELTSVSSHAGLLERGVFVAAHFDQAAHVEALVARFEQLLDARRGPGAAADFESLAAQSFRGLRKLGRRGTLERLLQQLSECLLQGQGLKALRARLGAGRSLVLRSLLHVAAGWFYTGADEQATAVLDEVRHLLYEERLGPKEQWPLARVYAATLGHAPIGLALDRIEELFTRLERIHDVFHTRSFSLAQVNLIETVVIAVASDDFSLGASVRRWLDEDEYLVRRRIHRDLRALL